MYVRIICLIRRNNQSKCPIANTELYLSQRKQLKKFVLQDKDLPSFWLLLILYI